MKDQFNFYLIVTLLATVNSQEICNTTCIEEILTNQESSLEILQNFVEGCFYSFVTPISMQLENIMNTLSTHLEALQVFISRCFQIYITPLSQKVSELQEFIYNNQTSQIQEVAETNLETLQTFISRCFQIYITPLSQKVFELQQFTYTNQTSIIQEMESKLNKVLNSERFEGNLTIDISECKFEEEFYRNLSLILDENREVSCEVPVCNCECTSSTNLSEVLYELSELKKEISETKTSVQVVEESTDVLEEIANKELDVSQWDLALTGSSIGVVLLLIIGCCVRLMCGGGGGVEGNLCSLNCFNAG